MHRFKLYFVFLLVIVFSACNKSFGDMLPPNIIFYLSDDQDKYDYGCYGNDLIRTPSVDRLASEGMVFENAFTAQAICAPSRSGILLHYTDVLPTFIEAAGGSPVESLDGRSFMNALKGDETEIHDFVYGVQTHQNILQAKIFPSRMIRSKKYKYIRNYNSVEVLEENFGANEYINAFIRIGAEKYKNIPFEELYDIRNDPFEQHSLAMDSEHKRIKEQLAFEMFDWMKDQGDFLSDTIGYMPILKANFNLDVSTPYNSVPDMLENSLKKEDYFVFDKPNILFMVVDDLRPELACFGEGQIHSPSLDKLAEGSLVFTRAYCNVPTCGASRASLLSGLRPGRHRFVSYDTRMDEQAPGVASLPMHFKNHGYTTISNGKVFHHMDDDTLSWHEIWRPDGKSSNYLLPENRELIGRGEKGRPFESADVGDDAYFDGKIANKVIVDLRRLEKSGEPFFLVMGFMKPHLPFNAPQQYWEMYRQDEISLPESYIQPETSPRQAFHKYGELRTYSGIPQRGHLSDDLAKELIHGYYACVSYVDAQIGRVLDELHRLELDEYTIVVLWGDHGWNLGEHMLWCKHCTFETSINAPLMVKAPGRTTGKHTAAITTFIDIYPSLCELAGIEKPGHLDGESFVPLITEGSREKNYAVSKFKDAVTLIKGDLFYTEWTDDRGNPYVRMLFDHSADPLEVDNLAEKVEYKVIEAQLALELREKWGNKYFD